MKYILLISMFILSQVDLAQTTKNNTLIQKTIKMGLNIDTFTSMPMAISDTISKVLPLDFTHENLYEIYQNKKTVGYYYLGKAFGKMDYFDFIVVFDANFIIEKIKVLTYREERGGEISSLRWLKQFLGLTPESEAIYNKNIAGISGATISGTSLTKSVNKLLKSIALLKAKKLLP